jgi:hypothetical protein
VYNLQYREFCSWQHTFLQNKENQKGAKQRNNNKINSFVFSIRIQFNPVQRFQDLSSSSSSSSSPKRSSANKSSLPN